MASTGKYRLGERLGTGGMAEVYRGTLMGAEGFSRSVAIKHMLPALSAEPDFEHMFKSEARIASHLSHPNIVSVLDFDRDDDGHLFLVMELVEGKDLRHLMEQGRLPVAASAFVVAKILEALDYAHRLELDGQPLGLVHRDVTPHNVLLSWEGHVKLSDFGIAKAAERTTATRTGVLKGKIGYMSPEQIEGEPLDGRSDLFCVGIILHELLTGERLFGGDLPDRVVLNRILIAPIPSPDQTQDDVPAALAEVCMKLLARDREARFDDAHAALAALLDTQAVSPRGALVVRELLDASFEGQADHPRRGSGAGQGSGSRSGFRAVPVGSEAGPGTSPLEQLRASTRPHGTAQLAGATTRPMSLDLEASVMTPPPQRALRSLAITLAILAVGLGGLLWWQQGARSTRLVELPAPSAAGLVAEPGPVAEPSPPAAERSTPTEPAPPAASTAPRGEPRPTGSKTATPHPPKNVTEVRREPSPTAASPRGPKKATAVRRDPSPTAASARGPKKSTEVRRDPSPATGSSRDPKQATEVRPSPPPVVASPPPASPPAPKPAKVRRDKPLGDDILAPSFSD